MLLTLNTMLSTFQNKLKTLFKIKISNSILKTLINLIVKRQKSLKNSANND